MKEDRNLRGTLRSGILLMAVALAVATAQQAFCQTDGDIARDADRVPYWIEMMRNPNVKLPTVQKAFARYFGNRKRQRGDGFKPFKRWEYWMLHHVQPDGQRPPDGTMTRTLTSCFARRPRAAGPPVWRELGPTHPTPDANRAILGTGRVNGLAFHPRDPNAILAASAGGGVWMSVDSGASWKTIGEGLPTLASSCVAFDPANPTTLYVGTGDIDGGIGVGMGVFRSTDSGSSWAAINTGIEGRTVGSILIHPSDSRRLLIGTDKGVFLSTDAGASWNAVSPEYRVFEMLAKPGDPTTAYVSADGYFLRSGDAGSSWQQVQAGLPRAYMSVGVTPAAPEVVYLLLGDTQDSSFAGFYKSTDSGRTFVQRSASPNILGYAPDGNEPGGQAWYDLCLGVDPRNADVVFAGGVNVWRSSDGGATWSLAGYWENVPGMPGVHADHHALGFSPHDGRLYSANDGGVYRLDPARNGWEDLNRGLAASMIYRIGQTPADPGEVIAGFQDNGFKLFSGSWTNLRSADGMEVMIAPEDPKFLLGTVYYGWLFRSFDRGCTLEEGISPNVSDSEMGGWITPVFMDARTPRTVYIGLCDVWRTDDIRAQSVAWKKIFAPPAQADAQLRQFRVLTQSPADPNLMFAAREDFRMWRTRNASDASPRWEEITDGLPAKARASAMVCSRRDADTVYLASTGRVYKSTDLGSAWRDITGTLPPIATYCLYHDEVARLIYAGTDSGVFCRPDDDAGDWTPYNAGMPFVPVYDLDIVATRQAAQPRVLRAATFGRGLWEAVPAVRSGEPAPATANAATAVAKVLPSAKGAADQPLVIERREPFPVTFAAGDAEVLVAEAPETAKADILLRLSDSQVSVSFEGKWVSIGTLGSVPRTMGASVHLESAVKRDDRIVLTFTHSLAAGKTRSFYVRKGGGDWQSLLTVTSKE